MISVWIRIVLMDGADLFCLLSNPPFQAEHCEIWNCVEFAVESEIFIAEFYAIIDVFVLNKFVE